MTSRFIIYGLLDPETSELRYVGQSSKGTKRPVEHWTSKRCLEAKDRCHTWVRGILKRGRVPEYIILEEVERREDLDDVEIFWIANVRSVGGRLTNMTDGGKGTSGFPSPQKGKPLSESHKRKIGDGNRGKVIPQWMRDIASRTHKGKIESAETRRRKSESHKGLIRSKEHCENLSKALKGKYRYPRVTLNCHLCQKEIVLSSNDARTRYPRVFCSLSCSGRYRIPKSG